MIVRHSNALYFFLFLKAKLGRELESKKTWLKTSLDHLKRLLQENRKKTTDLREQTSKAVQSRNATKLHISDLVKEANGLEVSIITSSVLRVYV